MAQQPDPQMAMQMAQQEMEYRVELFNKMVSSCFEKCIDRRYKEGELSVGENACIDRCSNKYWQATGITPWTVISRRAIALRGQNPSKWRVAMVALTSKPTSLSNAQTAPTGLLSARQCYRQGNSGSRLCRVSASPENKPEGLSNSSFADNSLAKQAGRQQISVEARSYPQNTSEPAPLGPPLGGLPGGLTPSRVDIDRWLNLGFLGAAAAVGIGAALHAGPNPWQTYQDAVAVNPIETKACISGVVYSLGDLIAQAYEGRDISEWDRGRVVRSGLCGLLAHGPLSHLYYVALDHGFAQQSLIPTDSWLVPLVKVGIDQTAWSILWNSTYYILLGLLKMESPQVITATVKSSWWDLLKAGWRLWPLVHVFTYGVIPVQHRLLFVDAIELVWVSILSMYGQQQRQKMEVDAAAAGAPTSWVACALPGGDGEGGDAAEEILRGIKAEHEIIFESPEGERVVLTPAEVYAAAPGPAGPELR